ncbi:MAG: RNA polymerase sigma factor [Pseudonocardiaceae bacterium]
MCGIAGSVRHSGPDHNSTTGIAAPNVSASDLLLRIGDSDPAAWNEIVRRYGQLVSATVRRFRLQDADALDAVQTTWLRLAENTHHIREPERLGGWLITTARHECLRILHYTKRAPRLTDTVTYTAPDPSKGPEQCLIDADTTQTLWNLVEKLSPRRQSLLRALFNDHSHSYAEIAQIVGIAPGGIGPTRARALTGLRHELEQHGFAPGALQ